MTAVGPRRYEPLIAAALIMLATGAGWFLMPRLMLLVSDGGPIVGAFVAILFILAFFGVLWLRARHQHRFDKD